MATIEQIIARYPRLFHMAEEGSWPSIQRQGLLSTTALLDLFEIVSPERTRIESQWRPRKIPISHTEHGNAVIRDQSPMDPHSLAPLLDGLTPGDWYEMINRKTFFWVTEERLGRFLNAKPYRGNIHDVITVDTRALVERHQNDITLAPFNTGVSSFGPQHQRGIDTFKSIQDYASGAYGVVELAVDYSVQDIAELAISVDQRQGHRFHANIWRR